jgi:hypothetical protein
MTGFSEPGRKKGKGNSRSFDCTALRMTVFVVGWETGKRQQQILRLRRRMTTKKQDDASTPAKASATCNDKDDTSVR